MCENCIRNIVKFAEPLECKICYQVVEVNDLTLLKQNKISLYSCFPVNVYMLGELALQLVQVKYITCVLDYFRMLRNLFLHLTYCGFVSD